MTFFRRRNKFKAVRTGGMASKLEYAVFCILKFREKSGEIKDIKSQVPVLLQSGDKLTRISWKCDFGFIDVKSGATVFAEAKGLEDQNFKLKLRLYRKVRTEKLEIWRGSYTKPFLSEVINGEKSEKSK